MGNHDGKEPSRKAVPYFSALFLLLLPLAATLCIVLPAGDESILNLLQERWFYLPLFGTYCVALLITDIINRVNLLLDKYYPWEQQFTRRLIIQLFSGWLFPSGLAFLVAYLYFSYLGVDIMATLYSRHMFPLIVLLILLMNILYCGYYYAWRLMENLRTNAIIDKTVYHDRFMLPEGTGITKVPVSELAYFYRKDEDVLARTHDKSIYLVSRSLDDIEPELDPKLFCRVNRAFIISRQSFRSCRKRPDGGLHMYLEPDVKELVNVSRSKAKEVLCWLSEV